MGVLRAIIRAKKTVYKRGAPQSEAYSHSFDNYNVGS